jgi:hypothetical protein
VSKKSLQYFPSISNPMEITLTQLTPKQQLFCDEYLTDMNATRAALRAGYSQESAMNGALMRKPKIKAHLDERLKDLKAKCPVTPEMMLAELAKIAFGNMGNYFDDDGKLKPMGLLSEDEKSALWHVKCSDDGVANLKMYNKLAAMEKIAKLMRFYEPKVAEPERIYVYLDKKNICEDDRFEDPTVDAPEIPFKEPVEFADEEGHIIYEEPIPYGPGADIYTLSMHDTPGEMLNKLNHYAALPLVFINGVMVDPQDIRLGLSAWLEEELADCGYEMKGDSLEQVYHKFRMLRLMRMKKQYEKAA